MSRDRYIYKVLTKDQWRKFQRDAVFQGSPVDLQDQVTLLQVDASKIDAALKYEISRGGAEFPHLFADLLMSAIGTHWLVSPENGAYRLPDNLHPN